MKKILFVTILLLPLFALAQYPGGVADPIVWLIPQYNEQGEVELWDKAQGQFITHSAAIEDFNFHPALKMEGEREIPALNISVTDLSRMQIFVVHEPRDSVMEKAIWSIFEEEKNALISTTHRLADFQENKFMNNLGSKKHQPQLNTYQRYVEVVEQGTFQLGIGSKGVDPSIPVQNFVGKMAEIIVYDRVLNQKEKAKVETYLALKYGIGIDKNIGQSLYSSRDAKLWDVQKLVEHSNEVAGIGWDDDGGLEQKQSGAMYDENIFSLALEKFYANNEVHKGKLTDQQFLIWGASDGILQLSEKAPGQVQQLNKKWLLRNHGFSKELTQLKFEVDKLPFEIAEDEIFWLVIDRSGSGEFPLGGTEYQAMDELENVESVFFSNVHWSGGDKQIFSLAKGPKMIPTLWIDQPECATETTGAMHLGVQGGQGPYQLFIKNKNEEIIASWQSDGETTRTIEGIESGNYQLIIIDREGLQYEEQFFINPSDAVFSNLQSSYELIGNETLHLDASLGLDNHNLDFSWTTPNGQTHLYPEIAIHTPGEYLLNINAADCRAQQKITVRQQLPNNFKNVAVFPNPSLGGYFEITADLFQSSPLEIKIFNASGFALRRIQLAPNHRHRYQDHLLAPGFYLLQLTANQSAVTKKLIVHAKP